MSDETRGQEQRPSGVNRRTVMKGAAWSVPVVMVASAAPAFAQSGILTFSGSACKLPGASTDVNKGYAAGLTVNNTYPYGVYITVVGMTVSNATSTLTFAGVQLENCQYIQGLGTPTPCFDPGQTQVAAYVADNGNSANAVVTLRYDVYRCSDDLLLVDDAFVSVPLSGDPWTPGGGTCRPHAGWPCDPAIE